MTISDLLARDLRVEWHEAVSLVRDVIQRGGQDAAEQGNAPDLHDVELLPWGEVKIHGVEPVDDPVERLVQTLQVLLGRSDPPVQLRLLISQTHESVLAFSQALEFFERPDRASILQGLYNRASAAAPLVDPEAILAAQSHATHRQPDKNPTDPGHERSPASRRLIYAAVLLIFLIGVTAAALYARRAEGASPIGDASEMVSKGVTEVSAAVGSAVSTIGDRVGLGGRPPAAPFDPVEAPKPAAAKPTVSKRPERPRVKTDSGAIEHAALSAFDLDLPRATMNPTPDDSGAASRPATPASNSPTGGSSEALVYSAASADVSGPIGIRPQLPKNLPSGVRAEDLTRIELLILPDGTVESVKLLSPPKTVHDWMLLSAAKAWIFHPAIKDGTPVKYRKTVWVAR
jgi:hypothetical protein